MSKKPHYYFAPKMSFNLPYFKALDFTPTLKNEVEELVSQWLCGNGIPCSRFYRYVCKTTLDQIDVDYDEGVFYYIHLNSYLREVHNVVWNFVNESSNKADKAKLDGFEKFCKANFK